MFFFLGGGVSWENNPSLFLYVEQLPFKGFMFFFYSSMVFFLLNGLFRSFYAIDPSYLVLLCGRCDLCNLDILTDPSILYDLVKLPSSLGGPAILWT